MKLFIAAFVSAVVVAATIANVNRGKGREAYQPADFMPFLPRKKPAIVTPEVFRGNLAHKVKKATTPWRKKLADS